MPVLRPTVSPARPQGTSIADIAFVAAVGVGLYVAFFVLAAAYTALTVVMVAALAKIVGVFTLGVEPVVLHNIWIEGLCGAAAGVAVTAMRRMVSRPNRSRTFGESLLSASIGRRLFALDRDFLPAALISAVVGFAVGSVAGAAGTHNVVRLLGGNVAAVASGQVFVLAALASSGGAGGIGASGGVGLFLLLLLVIVVQAVILGAVAGVFANVLAGALLGVARGAAKGAVLAALDGETHRAEHALASASTSIRGRSLRGALDGCMVGALAGLLQGILTSAVLVGQRPAPDASPSPRPAEFERATPVGPTLSACGRVSPVTLVAPRCADPDARRPPTVDRCDSAVAAGTCFRGDPDASETRFPQASRALLPRLDRRAGSDPRPAGRGAGEPRSQPRTESPRRRLTRAT